MFIRIRPVILAATVLALASIPACNRPTPSAPAPLSPTLEPAHPQSDLAHDVILKSLPPSATNLRWFGKWYLLYSNNGFTYAAIAYPNPSTNGITVTLYRLYENPQSF